MSDEKPGGDLIDRLNDIAHHDWRKSFLAHTSDTASEAAYRIRATNAGLKALLAERDRLRAEVSVLETNASAQAKILADTARERDRLREVVAATALQFRLYEQLHAAKPDMKKAEANAEWARLCEDALREGDDT